MRDQSAQPESITNFTVRDAPERLIAEVEGLSRRLEDVRASIGRVIFGQHEVIEQTLITLLSGGHVLLIGVPGLAKTKLVETLGIVFGLDEARIQCTPDLMPADIIGSEVLEEGESGRRSFRFIRGPVFCQLLMADEINRASPRTQSALLQAMQEKRVSIAGRYHPLPEPFHVLATQNPLEQEGTYPLPEAQLDRFLLQVNVEYPDLAAERKMLLATTGIAEEGAERVLGAAELLQAQRAIRQIPVGESVVEAILKLARSGRPETSDIVEVKQHVAWAPGPRASQALMLACRARAVLQGRLAPSIDDVVALAAPVLRHRMAVNFAARAEGIGVEHVIAKLVEPLT
jgi:MoxR-like ATPase